MSEQPLADAVVDSIRTHVAVSDVRVVSAYIGVCAARLAIDLGAESAAACVRQLLEGGAFSEGEEWAKERRAFEQFQRIQRGRGIVGVMLQWVAEDPRRN